MARSKRYLPPSDEQIRRWEEEAEAKRAFDAQRSSLIESSLRKLKKDQLIDLLMGLDTFDPAVRWSIESELRVRKPVDLLVFDLRFAIGIATRCDERQMNRNFDYSWQAYEETARGFQALLDLGELQTAKSVAIDFIAKASYQLECSDEGLMFDEIETCLKPVICSVRSGDADGAKSWAVSMVAADRLGTICEFELKKIMAA